MAVIDGHILAVGRNQMGQLGNDSFADSLTSGVAVMGLKDVVAVDGGRDFGLAVLQHGTVYAWGSNQQGDLGNGPGPSSPPPRQIPGLQDVVQVSAGNNHSLALLSNGTVMAWGDNLYGDIGVGKTGGHETPVPVPGLRNVVAVSAGWSQTCRLFEISPPGVTMPPTGMPWSGMRTDNYGSGETMLKVK
jgi:alpha-tubulin suppressor-like RCC1 family protein